MQRQAAAAAEVATGAPPAAADVEADVGREADAEVGGETAGETGVIEEPTGEVGTEMSSKPRGSSPSAEETSDRSVDGRAPSGVVGSCVSAGNAQSSAGEGGGEGGVAAAPLSAKQAEVVYLRRRADAEACAREEAQQHSAEASAKAAAWRAKGELASAVAEAETAEVHLKILQQVVAAEERTAAERLLELVDAPVRLSSSVALAATAEKAAACLLAVSLAYDYFKKAKAAAAEAAEAARAASSARADADAAVEAAKLVVAETAAREAAAAAEAAAQAAASRERLPAETLVGATSVAEQTAAGDGGDAASPAASKTVENGSRGDLEETAAIFARILREKEEAERLMRLDSWRAVWVAATDVVVGSRVPPPRGSPLSPGARSSQSFRYVGERLGIPAL